VVLSNSLSAAFRYSIDLCNIILKPLTLQCVLPGYFKPRLPSLVILAHPGPIQQDLVVVLYLQVESEAWKHNDAIQQIHYKANSIAHLAQLEKVGETKVVLVQLG